MSSSLVIPGFSFATHEEMAFLQRELAPERGWYSDAKRFADDEAVEQAYARGDLVEISDSDDVRLITRFRDKPDRFKAYLTPVAAAAFNLLGQAWRAELPSDLSSSSLRLAGTSFVRSEAYQAEILARGALASPDSTHCVGAAFDLDGAGYYAVAADGQVVSQGHPGRRQQQAVQRLLMDAPDETIPAYEYAYDARVNQAAVRAAHLLQNEGVINLVHEFEGTPNASLHIAAKPNC